MSLCIYKITNIINGKVYIGQAIRSVQSRFRRHVSDALNHIIDTHFARAINKYGEKNFIWEIIDTASTQEELNQKEKYWIEFYDACHKGYNTASGGFSSGGNTYANLSNLDEVRKKLSLSKMGGKNPHSRKIIMTDIVENSITIFPSMAEATKFLSLVSHMPVSRRCRGKIKSPLDNRYLFEYCDDEGITTMDNQ